MLKNSERYKELGQLILTVLSGTADTEQVQELRSALEHDPYAMQYYCEYVTVYSMLRQPGNVSFEMREKDVRVDESTLGFIWEELAEQEQMAESVRIRRRRWPWTRKKKKEAPEIRSVAKRVKLRREYSKAAIYTALSSAAAVLLVVVLIFAHENRAPVVARLTDAVNSRWHADEDDHEVGDNLRALRRTLLEGFAKLEFNSGTEVIVQGPAEIEPESDNQLMLYSGSVFSRVPEEAAGFVVRTPNATVIDYGTEFGVTSLPSGKTEVQVFDGEVEIRAGSDPVLHGATQKLYAGQSGLVMANGDVEMSDLADRGQRFAKELPEKTFAASGRCFDLADLVAGGNGFGSGKIGLGIDPVTGETIKDFTGSANRLGTGNYKVLTEDPFIDGVFVPDGGSGPQQVSSERHFTSSIPDTTGVYWSEITTDAKVAIYYTAQSKRYIAKLGGVEYGNAERPALLMHANVGITFDLESIRQVLPCQRISAFKSLCGISEPKWDCGKVDFRILIDGKQRFVAEAVTADDGVLEIDIPVSDDDRFLTLTVTDGGDKNWRDWAVFAQPHLEVTATSLNGGSAVDSPRKSGFGGVLDRLRFKQ